MLAREGIAWLAGMIAATAEAMARTSRPTRLH